MTIEELQKKASEDREAIEQAIRIMAHVKTLDGARRVMQSLREKILDN
jgi:hypothetical protein